MAIIPNLNSSQLAHKEAMMLSQRAVSFFWHQSNPITGFTKDRATNFKSGDDHPVASCASIGFALSAYVIGTHHHWLNRHAALSRTRLTLSHLLTTYPRDHGWFYHFVDWKTGKRAWNCEVSSIDTSILLAGVMVADRYWHDPAVHSFAKKIEDQIDWQWMLTSGGTMPNSTSLDMGYIPEKGWIPARWDSYCELTMLYIQGYGFDSKLPASCWKLVRRPVINFDGIKAVAGGPLFMHEMSQGFYDLKNKRDEVGMDYWLNTRNAALINRAYCIQNPNHFKDYGPNFWGLSACDTPTGYSADGAPQGPDDGTITPTSAIAALPYTPTQSMEIMRSLLKNHADALGRYGFSNGINPTKDWNGPDVIGIDLGMMLVGIDGWNDGLIHKLSSEDPIVQKGMRRMGFHFVKSNPNAPLFAYY